MDLSLIIRGVFLKKEICYTVPSISSRNGVTKVVANITNALCRTGKYNITVLAVDGTEDNAIALNDEIKVITIGANANGNKLNYLMQIILGVRRVLSSYTPDIIVVSGAEYVLPFSLALCGKGKSISMFQWEHRNFDAGPKFRLEWLGKRWALAFWKGIVCITKRDAMLYMSHTDKKDKINQIYNMNAFNAIRKPYNRRSKKIISCGYLAPIKGFDMLVDVAKKVFDQHPDWQWDIYGEGNEKDRLEQLIEKRGLRGKVVLKGYNPNINEIYGQYSFFVMTSRMEGMGMVLIEAQKAGLPVVSFDCKCGPSDVIVNGENGYLISCFDIDNMANKICDLIEHEELRSFFSQNSEMCLAEFEKKVIIDKWYSLLDT